MRNVNLEKALEVARKLNSFILTMRNVNIIRKSIPCIKCKRFYINYEECKCRCITTVERMSKGFILTMRNVNKVVKLYNQLNLHCFILTMRNVNKEELKKQYFSNLDSFILTMRNVNINMI